MSTAEDTGKGFRGTAFLRESWSELKKVSCPTRQETTQATIVVLIIMMIVAAFLAMADWVFSIAMRSLLSA